MSDNSRYISRHEKLKDERRSWEAHWKEISEFVLPRKGIFDRERVNDGSPRGNRIVDSTATRALRVLAAGMQGGLTSPARPWFRLSLGDNDCADRKDVRNWLGKVEKAMYRALARSNFYSCIHSLYTELAGFGTGVLYCEPDNERGVRFRCLTVGEYSISTDMQGRVDSVYREFRMTARQLESRFGRKVLPAGVVSCLESDRDRWFDVLHAVQPRNEFDSTRLDNINMPFESVFILQGMGNPVLSVSGFVENPYMAPRWDTSGGDVYGRSPAMDVLADVKMLMEMSRSQIQAVHLSLRPPMKVPSMYTRRLNLLPGGQNPVEQNLHDSISPLYQINADLNGVSAKIADVRDAVREGFFNDIFLMMAGMDRRDVTATEVAERHEEKLIQLGPVIERQHSELLDPLLDRVFGILNRAGCLPPAPAVIRGLDIKIDYISVLAQAQKIVGTGAIKDLAAFVGQLSAVNPEVLDKIDMDKAVDEYAGLIGVSSDLVRSDDEVRKFRESRYKEASQKEELENGFRAAEKGADIVGKFSKAGINFDDLQSIVSNSEQL
ncbi:portal protein [Maridesulfovibrio bastinii]|uniref:portal protein n=1 Tax=Maridesulfovibrio bastinii TaxID=47157 RepID=UPI0003FD3DC2|nr:portal protein [Maridesulfovibrio bastinii]